MILSRISGGHLGGDGRGAIGHDAFDLATENFFVKFEGLFALTVETKIRINFHDTLLAIKI